MTDAGPEQPFRCLDVKQPKYSSEHTLKLLLCQGPPQECFTQHKSKVKITVKLSQSCGRGFLPYIKVKSTITGKINLVLWQAPRSSERRARGRCKPAGEATMQEPETLRCNLFQKTIFSTFLFALCCMLIVVDIFSSHCQC